MTTTEISAALGVLTFREAAQRLPVPAGNQDLALQRLIARGAIRSIVNPSAPDAGITVESLRDFLVNGAANSAVRITVGAPTETILPVFESRADTGWFDTRHLDVYLEMVRDPMIVQLRLQMPTAEEMEAAKKFGSMRYSAVAMAGQDVFQPVTVTGEMRKLLQLPIDTQVIISTAAGKAKSVNFRNVGELYLVFRAQEIAKRIVNALAESSRQTAGVEESLQVSLLGTLYRSPALYANIIDGIRNAMRERGPLTETMRLERGTLEKVTWTFGLYIPEFDLISAANTSFERIVGLAF